MRHEKLATVAPMARRNGTMWQQGPKFKLDAYSSRLDGKDGSERFVGCVMMGFLDSHVLHLIDVSARSSPHFVV